MAKKLNSTVHVTDDKGETRVFGPGEDVPAAWAKFITNDAAWDESDEKTDEKPKGGK